MFFRFLFLILAGMTQVALGQTGKLTAADTNIIVTRIIRDINNIQRIARTKGDRALAKKYADEIKKDLALTTNLPNEKIKTVEDFMKTRYPGFFRSANRSADVGTRYSKGGRISCEDQSYSGEQLLEKTKYQPVSKFDFDSLSEPYTRCYTGMSFRSGESPQIQSAVTGQPFLFSKPAMVAQNGERNGTSGIYIYMDDGTFMFVDPKTFDSSCSSINKFGGKVFFKYNGQYCQIESFFSEEREASFVNACYTKKPEFGWPNCNRTLGDSQKMDAQASKTRLAGMVTMIQRRGGLFARDEERVKRTLLEGDECQGRSYQERPNPLAAIEELKLCSNVPDREVQKVLNDEIKALQALAPKEASDESGAGAN